MTKHSVYEKRVVCFIDILGFTQWIKTSEKLDNEGRFTQEAISSQHKILRTLRLFEQLKEIEEKKNSSDFIMTHFSDSLVISFPVGTSKGLSSIIARLMMLQLQLSIRGVMIRGGLALGDVYHTREKIFGPAYIEASRLEKVSAKYPRIVFSKDFLAIALAKEFDGNETAIKCERYKLRENVLTYDEIDGVYFIDFLKWFLVPCRAVSHQKRIHTLKKRIQGGIMQCKKNDADILAKYRWLAIRYNENVSTLESRSIEENCFDAYKDQLQKIRPINLDLIDMKQVYWPKAEKVA